MHLDPITFRHARCLPIDNRLLAAREARLNVTQADIGALAERLPIILPVAADRLPQALLIPAEDQHPFDTHTPSTWQHYPFSLIEQGNLLDAEGGLQRHLSLQVDERAPHLRQDDGYPLFDAQGQPSVFLRGVIHGLRQHRQQIEQTLTLLEHLEQAGVLVRTRVRHGSQIIDCRLINPEHLNERLDALPEAQRLSVTLLAEALLRSQAHLQRQGRHYATAFDDLHSPTHRSASWSLRLSQAMH